MKRKRTRRLSPRPESTVARTLLPVDKWEHWERLRQSLAEGELTVDIQIKRVIS